METKEISDLLASHGYTPCTDCNETGEGKYTKNQELCSDCESVRIQEHLSDIEQGAEVMSLVEIMSLDRS
jgi:ketol-acid reductoisomerase